MTAQDIRMTGDDEQLLLIKALPPILAGRMPFWFIQPWAGWAADNPVEGPTPFAIPRIQLEYRERKSA
jgi:type IV secretion system protein VirD4